MTYSSFHESEHKNVSINKINTYRSIKFCSLSNPKFPVMLQLGNSLNTYCLG